MMRFLAVLIVAIFISFVSAQSNDGSCAYALDQAFLPRVTAAGGGSCATVSCASGKWTIPCFLNVSTACDQICDFKTDKVEFTQGVTFSSSAGQIYVTINPVNSALSGQIIVSGGVAALRGRVNFDLAPGVGGTVGDKVHYFFLVQNSGSYTGKFSISAPIWQQTIACRLPGASAATFNTTTGQFVDYSIIDSCSGASALEVSFLGVVALVAAFFKLY